MIELAVDPESSVTLYDQLRTQLIENITGGALISGTKLPTVRALATQLTVAPYTVARVYRLLEQDGFLETRGRNGTVVSARDDAAGSTLQLEASRYATRAAELGVSAEDALAYVRTALGAPGR